MHHIWGVLVILVTLTFQSLPGALASDPCDELTRDERRALAVQWIDQLAENGMIIVLESNRRQIEYLSSLVDNSAQRTDRQIKRDQEKLKELEYSTRKRALNSMKAFEDHFDFAKVFFIWDYNLPHVRSNPDTALFLDRDLELNTEISLHSTDDVFFLVGGRVPQSRGSGLEAYMVGNQEYRYLCPPFPYYVGRNNNWFLNALISVFIPDAYDERSLIRIAELFQENFKNFTDSNTYKLFSSD